MPLSRKLAAEFIGTFWLVLGGCGSAVLAAAFPEVGIGLLGVSLAFGLTVLTMAYAIGHISGCHLNPAVTIGRMFSDTFAGIAPSAVPAFLAAQAVGAVLGAVLVELFHPRPGRVPEPLDLPAPVHHLKENP